MTTMVRKFTREWLRRQPDFFAVGYWGIHDVSLWKVLDVYAQADSERDDIEAAIADEFPISCDDLSFCRGKSWEEIKKQIDGCTYVRVFLDGEMFEAIDLANPANQ